MQNENVIDSAAPHVPNFVSGTIAFYCTALSSTFLQYKFLKLSTGTQPRVIPITAGMMTVAMGSWMSHLAGLGTSASFIVLPRRERDRIRRSSTSVLPREETAMLFRRLEQWRENIRVSKIDATGGAALRTVSEMMRPMMSNAKTKREKRERGEVWMHAARVCIIGLLTYKTIFRSHFTSISPSSYTARGSFARIGIPAPPNFNYATRTQRQTLEKIGRWWGCHTCGSRQFFSNAQTKFHGDHIPPVSVAKQLNAKWYRRKMGWKVPQKFYPQCVDCSNRQGGLLAKAIRSGESNLRGVGGGNESYFHGRRLRIGHLTGGVIAVMSVDRDDLIDGSRDRVRGYQDFVEELARLAKQRVQDAFRGWR